MRTQVNVSAFGLFSTARAASSENRRGLVLLTLQNTAQAIKMDDIRLRYTPYLSVVLILRSCETCH